MSKHFAKGIMLLYCSCKLPVAIFVATVFCFEHFNPSHSVILIVYAGEEI